MAALPTKPSTADGQSGASRGASAPRLRFPEFRNRGPWDAVTGDKLFDPIDRRPAAPGLPVLAITQEHGAIPREHINYHVSVTDASLASYKEVRPKDFIISLRSFQGGIEYSRHRGICSPAYVILSRKGKGSDDFYRHLFKSERFIQQITRNIEGLRDGKMISFTQFSEQLLPAPQPDEQQKIADCLTSLNEAIAAQARKVEALKAHKKGLMQHLFPREGESVPRLRFREFRGAPEWKKCRISGLLEKRSQPATLDDDTLYREIGVRSHGKGLFHKAPKTGKAIGEKRVFHVIPNALVINIVFAWEQALAVTTEAEAGFIASHRFPMFVPKEKRCDVAFMQRLFLLPTGKQLLKVASPGGAGRNRTLSQTEFEHLEVVVPETAEQKRIADCLDSLEAVIAAEDAILTALKTHKTGLMQGLFPSPFAGYSSPGDP